MGAAAGSRPEGEGRVRAQIIGEEEAKEVIVVIAGADDGGVGVSREGGVAVGETNCGWIGCRRRRRPVAGVVEVVVNRAGPVRDMLGESGSADSAKSTDTRRSNVQYT